MSKVNKKYIFPVLLSFFVMSFCDLVGIGVDRIKPEFNLSNTLAQLIPSAVFIWFFFLSVPVGVLQDRIGKRLMLNAGMGITLAGLMIPYLFYSFAGALAGFALLGIGNTIVQVSANPLLVDVVPQGRASSYLSFSQFIKSVGSMIAPPLAGWLASAYGDWRLMFPVFGAVSLIAVIWLGTSAIPESNKQQERATFSSSLSLLSIRFITLMVIGIFLLVGIDVGINSVSGQYFLIRFHSAQTFAESGRSFYFFGKMAGTFLGAFLLTKLAARPFLRFTSVLSVLALVFLLLAPGEGSGIAAMALTGLAVANIFPLIFAITIEKYADRANEISGLMIMAVSGGAAVPPLIGWMTDSFGVAAGISVLMVCALYLLLLSLSLSRLADQKR
jgi:MFS transporter, FHS family, L-fucose permease